METPFALLVRGIHWWLVDYPHKWSVMWSSDVFVHCQSDEQLVESPLMWNCMMMIWLHWNHLHMIDILEIPTFTLLWCHNGHDGFSNHQPHHCLLNCLFSRRSKKTSNLCVTGLCVGNSAETGEFPAQMASNAENFSIWWRHHDHRKCFLCYHKQYDTHCGWGRGRSSEYLCYILFS